MHDILKQRLLRRLEALPEEQLYQALDYIEFLESKYGSRELSGDVTGLQRFAERLEDGLRRRTVRPSTLREAFQLISAADRALSGLSTVGRDLLEELERGGVEEESGVPDEETPGGVDPGPDRRPGGGDARS